MVPVLRYRIEIVQFESDWQPRFEEEKARLRLFFGEHVVAYEHIGSTSVPGLSGKPILDIAVAVRTLDDARSLIPAAAEAGYFPIECAANDRFDLWRRQGGEAPTHILHFMQLESDAWRRPIAFRDALRADERLMTAYAELKSQLANAHQDDIRAYGKGKTEFIENVLERALRAEA